MSRSIAVAAFAAAVLSAALIYAADRIPPEITAAVGDAARPAADKDPIHLVTSVKAIRPKRGPSRR